MKLHAKHSPGSRSLDRHGVRGHRGYDKHALIPAFALLVFVIGLSCSPRAHGLAADGLLAGHLQVDAVVDDGTDGFIASGLAAASW